jgi:L-cysteine:1D-myo-inositol 2-amino-2-deoxy-alpha-D-glucopyranoside ligase
MAGEKMSKSLGNLAFVHDLVERHEPAAIRAFLLRRHYRRDWSFDEEDLLREAKEPPDLDDAGPFDALGERQAFYDALDNDLDTPTAMRILDRAERSGEPGAEGLAEEARDLLGLSL